MSVFEESAPSCLNVFRKIWEFKRDRTSVADEPFSERPKITTILGFIER